MLTIYDQIISFLVTIGIGFLAGILFDIYRVIRSLWQPRKIGTFIGDMVFWIILTIVAFILLLLGNWGELRIYVFLGICLGYYIYQRRFSKKTQKIIKKIIVIFLRGIKYLWLGITWPFKIAYKILLIPFGFFASGVIGISRIINKGFHKFFLKVKKKVKNLFKSKKV